MKVKFNVENLNSQVVPHLNNAIGNINSLIALDQQLVIPRNFKYRNYLLNMINSNSAAKREIQQVLDWIKISNNNYNATLTDINQLAKSIKNVEIRQRQSSIR